jgi:hypothetical protein
MLGSRGVQNATSSQPSNWPLTVTTISQPAVGQPGEMSRLRDANPTATATTIDDASLIRAMWSDEVAAQRAVGRTKRLREALHAVLTSDARSAMAAITEAYVSAVRHYERSRG